MVATRSHGHGGVLELIENRPFDVVENALNGSRGYGRVAVCMVEEPNEDGGITNDKGGGSPHTVALHVLGVLFLHDLESATRVDVGPDLRHVHPVSVHDWFEDVPVAQ